MVLNLINMNLLNSYKFRRFFSLFIMALALMQTGFRIFNLAVIGGNNWGIGEWLINYGGGFIRRGLFGELFLILTPLTGNNALFLLVSIQFILILVITSYLIYILKIESFKWGAIALICSPLAINFIAWDRYVFARKELIGIFCLVLLAFSIRSKYLKTKFLIPAVLLLYFIGTFSSEVNIVLFPGLIYLLYLRNNLIVSKKLFFQVFIVLSISISAFITSIFYSGNVFMSNEMCRKAVLKGFDPALNCQGGIFMMRKDINDFLKLLADAYVNSFYTLYLFILILSLIPIFLTRWFSLNWKWFIFIFSGWAPLMFIALDYGRNIFILVMQLTICITASNESFREKSRKLFTPLIVISYTLMWGAGHTGNPITNGWIAMIPTTIRVFLNEL